MNAPDLHDLTDDALREHLKTARRDLFGKRLQHATGELEDTASMRSVKRDIARALTVAKQRGIDVSVQKTPTPTAN